jgi:hypothetical protein
LSIKKYSSRKIKLRAGLFFLCLFASSCVSDNVWNMKKGEVKEKLVKSDFAFLKDFDLKNKNPADVVSLGNGAAYYTSRIFSDLGQHDVEYKLLMVSFTRENSMWKEAAGILLLDALLGMDKNAECERYARECMRISLDPENISRAKRAYLKALYKQKKDEELLSRLRESFPETLIMSDPELLLYRAAAIARIGKEDATLLFISLFISPSDKWIRTDARAFLGSIRSGMLANPILAKLMLARDSIDAKAESVGYPLLEDACASIDIKQISSESIIMKLTEELALWRLEEKEYKKGISFITELIKKLDGNPRITALEMLGRLYRRAGLYNDAAKSLAEVASQTTDHDQEDRALWYRLVSLREAGAPDFTGELVRASIGWNDSEYFDDVLEDTVNVLVSKRKWQELLALYNGLAGKESKQIHAQLSYILGRATSLGFIKTADKDAMSKTFLLEAMSAGNANYHSFLASSILGQLPPLFVAKTTAGTSGGTPGTKTGLDEFVKGFFDFGLIDKGMIELKSRIGEITDEALFYSMQKLDEMGYFKDNIRIANKSAYIKLYNISRDTITRQYPMEYSSHVTEFAKRDKIGEHILYALLREESAFDNSIVSRTGAVGLSQLMPDTAKDTATLLRLKEYDLNDAKTNISIGSYHLAKLINYFDSYTKALIAYNAGSTRVKDWTKQNGDLPLDLFVETIPFYETRDYVRKVISAAFVYGYIYYDIPLPKIATSFFPGIIR